MMRLIQMRSSSVFEQVVDCHYIIVERIDYITEGYNRNVVTKDRYPSHHSDASVAVLADDSTPTQLAHS